MYFYLYLYRDARREYRWSLHAANNKKIADSGEGYRNKADCLHAMNLIAGALSVPIRKAPDVD
jgi:uncharacterized protein YegP (UPF0339 family)